MNALAVEMTRAELARNEKTIESGRQAFVEVGNALREIRDRRGYRFEFGTFEEYCKARWEWDRRNVSYYIGASEVALELGSQLPNLGLTQAVELASVAKSDVSKLDEQMIAVQLKNQRETWEQMVQGKEPPLRIWFLFRRGTKREFDYLNMAQGVMDAMVRAEYIPDDDAVHVIPFFKPFIVDRQNPGVEIYIG